MTTTTSVERVQTCPCCGLAQHVPEMPPRTRACCVRCATTLKRRSNISRAQSRTAAVALAALILYPPAILLPMLRIERFGHHSDASILEGGWRLLTSGHAFIGIVVLLCSVVFPLGKLLAMLVLCSGLVKLRCEHKALTYHIVEWTGRWGMLDVLLVAVLVAALKLGDMVEVSPGPAAIAFAACVVLSLLATALFDPHTLWEIPERR